MKKIRVVCLILSIILVVSGVSIQIYLRAKKGTPDNNAGTESGNKEAASDIYDATDFKQLNSISEKTGVHITEISEENIVLADGYKFDSFDLMIEISKDDKDNVLEFEGNGYLFSEGETVSALAYREKIQLIIDEFSNKTGAPTDSYKIYDDQNNLLGNDEDSSFQAIIDGNAELIYYVKDTDGNISMLRSRFEHSFNAHIFEYCKFLDPQMTKDMRYDVDLSETATEGQ